MSEFIPHRDSDIYCIACAKKACSGSKSRLNSRGNLLWFRFPDMTESVQEKDRFFHWVRLIGCWNSLKENEEPIICSDHFSDAHFHIREFASIRKPIVRLCLRRNAYPDMFLSANMFVSANKRSLDDSKGCGGQESLIRNQIASTSKRLPSSSDQRARTKHQQATSAKPSPNSKCKLETQPSTSPFEFAPVSQDGNFGRVLLDRLHSQRYGTKNSQNKIVETPENPKKPTKELYTKSTVKKGVMIPLRIGKRELNLGPSRGKGCTTKTRTMKKAKQTHGGKGEDAGVEAAAGEVATGEEATVEDAAEEDAAEGAEEAVVDWDQVELNIEEGSEREGEEVFIRDSMFLDWDCLLCGDQDHSSRDALVAHLTAHHREDGRCRICGNEYTSLFVMLEHLYLSHNDSQKSKCCRSTFTSPIQLTRHIVLCHEKTRGIPATKGPLIRCWRVVCSFCSTGFLYRANLYLHLNTVHDIDPSYVFKVVLSFDMLHYQQVTLCPQCPRVGLGWEITVDHPPEICRRALIRSNLYTSFCRLCPQTTKTWEVPHVFGNKHALYFSHPPQLSPASYLSGGRDFVCTFKGSLQWEQEELPCPGCDLIFEQFSTLTKHYVARHTQTSATEVSIAVDFGGSGKVELSRKYKDHYHPTSVTYIRDRYHPAGAGLVFSSKKCRISK